MFGAILLTNINPKPYPPDRPWRRISRTQAWAQREKFNIWPQLKRML